MAGFILGFGGVGILTYLLNSWGLSNAHRLQALYQRLFFPLVLPLTPMLFLSIWRRVSEYGVTETRYLGILSAFWLVVVSLYFIISKRKDQRIVPASLCLIILLVSIGPWGVMSTSSRSQTQRLAGLLAEAGLLGEGKLRMSATTIAPQLLTNINQTIVYLHKRSRIEALVEWSGGKIALDDLPETIADKIGIDFVFRSEYSQNHFDFATNRMEGIDISGFDSLCRLDIERYGAQGMHCAMGTRPVLSIKPEENFLRLTVSLADGQGRVVNVES